MFDQCTTYVIHLHCLSTYSLLFVVGRTPLLVAGVAVGAFAIGSAAVQVATVLAVAEIARGATGAGR